MPAPLLNPDEIAAMNNTEVVYAVDDSGNPIGLVPPGNDVHVVPKPPPGAGWRWDAGSSRYVMQLALADAQTDARDLIDRTAGEARLRYITDVPGQQAVYLQKLADALAYRVAGYAGAPPPYVQGEVQASASGTTAQQAADTIIATAGYWLDKSVAIEAQRLAGKRAVMAASSSAEVAAALNAATAALNAL